MELPIIDKANKEKGKRKMPSQFSEKVRPDLILRAVFAVQSSKRQRYGAFEDAGNRHSAELSRRRKNYRGSYGIGISRVPRKIMSRRGTRMNWVAANVPCVVGGRRAHPPVAIKNWEQKINKVEKRKAIRSALSAALDKNFVQERGHNVPAKYPFIIDASFEEISKTKDMIIALKAIGLEKELERSAEIKVRAGKGKLRGRKYKRKKGVLLVVGDSCKLMKGARNIPGVDIVKMREINAELLAPGGVPGRLTLFTESAINSIEKEKLFE